MPRDYKHRANPKRRKQSVPGWLWLLAGLLIGLFVAFLVYLKQPADPDTPQPNPVVTTDEDARAVRTPRHRDIPPPPKPRFDFYQILPEMEVVVPEEAITGSRKEGVRQVETPGTYLLQAGSFKSAEQADQLKARLAMLGLETHVQTVSINESETWHRVRVGPFDNLRSLNRARARLREHDVEAILLKVKNQGN